MADSGAPGTSWRTKRWRDVPLDEEGWMKARRYSMAVMGCGLAMKIMEQKSVDEATVTTRFLMIRNENVQ